MVCPFGVVPSSYPHYPGISFCQNWTRTWSSFRIGSGASFTHFLYDWVTRIYYFCQSGITDYKNCIFVMGGAPTEFHDRVLLSLCRLFGLKRENFHFPITEQNIVSSGKIFWFGDQQTFMHPAQMVHPQSIAAIRKVVADISVPVGDWPYIYISRGDTGARRLQNEAEILPKLEALGFKSIRLAELPILDQLSVLRGAKCIAPHGMGLSNIVFNQGPLRVVELHSPIGGTEAYALISRAMGFSYDYVVGVTEDPRTKDFSVQWEDLEPKIQPWLGGAEMPRSVDVALPSRSICYPRPRISLSAGRVEHSRCMPA